MKKILLFILLLGSSVFASPAQNVFDEVSYYLVINYGGAATIDVRTLPDKYQTQLEAACIGMANTCPVEKAYPVIEAMLAELKDEHTGFYPNLGELVRDLLSGNLNQTGVGIQVDLLENSVYIRSVLADSPAAKAGLQRADKITHLDFAAVNRRTFWENWNKINSKGGYISFLRQGQSFRVQLLPAKLESALPSLEVRSDGIAVLKIPNFFGRGQGTVANQVHTLLSKLQNTKGLILELRDNLGGFVADCTGVAAAFLENAQNRFVARTAFGSVDFFFLDNKIWQRRANTESYLIELVSPARYRQPVVVLQNSSSASCAEFLSSNLQEKRRAIILGEISAGVANTSVGLFILSDQSALQLSLNTRVDTNGKRFAATIAPDETIPDDLATINTTGKDLIFDRAVAILQGYLP